MMELSKDLREFIRLVNHHEVQYLIVGAWALAFHGRPRYTGDLDVFVANDSSNAEKVMAVLNDFGFGDVGISKSDLCQSERIIQLGYEPNRIDILTSISGVSFEEAWAQKIQGAVGTAAMNFIDRELLIVNKRATGRDKDLVDVRLLEKLRRE